MGQVVLHNPKTQGAPFDLDNPSAFLMSSALAEEAAGANGG